MAWLGAELTRFSTPRGKRLVLEVQEQAQAARLQHRGPRGRAVRLLERRHALFPLT